MGKNAEESAKLIQLMHDSAVALELKTKVEREAADLAKKIISLQGETTAGKIEEIITERAFIEKHKEALVTIRDGVKDYSIYNQLLAKLAARFRDLATIEQPDLAPGEFREVMQVADPKEALDVRLGVLSADAANRLDLERAIINETNLLVDQKYLTEEEGMDHHVERMKQLEAEILENKKMSLGEATQMTLDSFSAMTSAMSTQINARMKNEIDVLKGTMKYKRADSDARKKMEKDITDSFGKEKERVAKYEKAASFAQASISIAEKIAKAIPNVVLMGIIAAMGAIQLAAIATTPIPKFATGGMIGGRRHSSGGTMIEAEAGEFVMRRSAVQSVGLENLNAMNAGGGGGSVTVNVSGNVLTQDFVEGELAENIKEAIRRGTDFGIS